MQAIDERRELASLPRSRFMDVTQRCEGDYELARSPDKPPATQAVLYTYTAKAVSTFTTFTAFESIMNNVIEC